MLAGLHGVADHLVAVVEDKHGAFEQSTVRIEAERNSGIGLSFDWGAEMT